MDQLIQTSVGALEIAGSLCGVPYVGTAAIVLRDIIDCCNQVAVQKRKSIQLANKCTQLLCTLDEQNARLEGTELRDVTDHMEAVLQKVQKRVKRWSELGRIKSFIKNKDIGEALTMCESELDSIMSNFQMSAQITLHHTQQESLQIVQSNAAETRELLLQILTSQQEMGDIYRMQLAGEHVAEPIMRAGQEELRSLRFDPVQTSHSEVVRPASASEHARAPQPHDGQRYLQYQRGLMTLHKLTGVLPAVKRLDGEVEKVGDMPVAGGTFSDVWFGKWLGEEKVALKALRNIKASDSKAKARFENEVNVWANLHHGNILPFYGIVTNLGQHIYMVSQWQDNGNVLDYVRAHHITDKVHLLAGAAKGVDYLHSRGVTHGNLKCANILVSANGEPRICDFGMSKVVEEVTEVSATATLTSPQGSARWLAPELIEGTISSPTLPADTYAYAMAALELITLKHPYAHRRRDASVIHDVVVLRQKPPRPLPPSSIANELWKLMEDCWCSDASMRPPMSQVAARMAAIESDSLGGSPSVRMDDS